MMPEHIPAKRKDVITPRERALIDDFIDQKGVTVCPPCAFSAPPDKALSYAKQNTNNWANIRRGNKLRKAEAEEESAALEELIGQGMKPKQIAHHLGISLEAVKARIKRLQHRKTPPRGEKKERKNA